MIYIIKKIKTTKYHQQNTFEHIGGFTRLNINRYLSIVIVFEADFELFLQAGLLNLLYILVW